MSLTDEQRAYWDSRIKGARATLGDKWLPCLPDDLLVAVADHLAEVESELADAERRMEQGNGIGEGMVVEIETLQAALAAAQNDTAFWKDAHDGMKQGLKDLHGALAAERESKRVAEWHWAELQEELKSERAKVVRLREAIEKADYSRDPWWELEKALNATADPS